MAAYRPQSGSIAWRVIEYFTTNPEEILSSGDVAEKFEVPTKQVHSLLGPAVEAGVLLRRTDEDDELVYRIGTGLPQIRPNRLAHPTLKGAGIASVIAAPPKRGPRCGAGMLVAIDIESIQPEDNVPVPTSARARLGSMVRAKLQTLKPGQSIRLPASLDKTVGPVLTELRKQGAGMFTKRVLDDEHLRVWRIE